MTFVVRFFEANLDDLFFLKSINPFEFIFKKKNILTDFS